ncbi:DUF4153 domain-containing protein [Sphingomonas desiccabilis]|uniref:DUF4173 domain-containing protein n=1 Tax=Sphingomonas desiccabilis TaxID=429134 RepID=A0A4Q2ITD0_9SPHN|nr:DUF4173 domain-containing protein [Sphingomonas desiccabilis]MBB3911462.1 hypothetical protein [Sphingomonas desiccabilis]RXZ31767.1 DUF4173 domain-containing protein [Sphingomonas desiccabilis]
MTASTYRPRFTFLRKALGAVALIAVAQLLFYGEEPGATLGVFALAWTAVVALTRPDLRRNRAALGALLVAVAAGLALVDDPDPLDWCLFWAALASAVLLPQHRFGSAIGWTRRLFLHGLVTPVAVLQDMARLRKVSPARPGTGPVAVLAILALPLLGGATFLALFATANPLIGNAFAAIRLPDFSSALFHLIFWSFVLLLVWPSLRPRHALLRIGETSAFERPRVPDVPLATLALSLVTFNAIFAIENALDLAFLWSGAPLPDGVTLADYAHRGAYPLIVTALLAAAFVLVAARPGSSGARSRFVRRLVLLWVAQNLLLVCSSILRTLDYVAAYSLTGLRIAALAWMALVAVGLVLIVWRMLAGRTSRWLVNANALAGCTVLAAASVADPGAIAAAWNVRHARAGDDLDLCYLERLGASALLPLIELERRAGGPILRDRVTYLRAQTLGRVEREQADWHSWTWRNARRLAAARAMLGSSPPLPRPAPDGRDCGGVPVAPPAPPPTAPTPLTEARQP